MAFKIEEQAVKFRWPVTVQCPKDGGGHDEVEIEATLQHMPPSWREKRKKEAEAMDEAGKPITSKDYIAWLMDADLDVIVDLHHIDRLGLLRIVDEDGTEITETCPLDPETKRAVISKLHEFPHIRRAINEAYKDAISGAEHQPKHRVKNSETPSAT